MSRWEILVAGIALLAGLWGQAKRVVDWIGGLLVITVSLDAKLAYAVAGHLERTGSRPSKSHQRLISGTWWWVKPLNKFAGIAYESILGSTRTFWIGRYPVWFALVTDKPISEHPFTFSFFRGTVDWNALVSQIAMSLYPTSREHSITYHFGTSVGAELATQKLNETTRIDILNRRCTGLSNSYRAVGWEPSDLGKGHLPTGPTTSSTRSSPHTCAMPSDRPFYILRLKRCQC
jgi:hypothetical protein